MKSKKPKTPSSKRLVLPDDKQVHLNISFEKAIKRAVGAQPFNKMAVGDIISQSRGRVMEIKLTKEVKTVFGKIINVMGGNRGVGSFDVIINFHEVDNFGEVPKIATKMYSDGEIEGIRFIQL